MHTKQSFLILTKLTMPSMNRHLGEKSRLVVIKKAGHAVNLEKDKEVCKNIVEYLREPILSALNGEKV